MSGQPRRVCFVTGTRAEFGLMRSVLSSIAEHPKLKLQLIVTGMHLHARHGSSINSISKEGWKVDAIVPWKLSDQLAGQTGLAMARLAGAFSRLKTDIVLVVGDRVEAFAAAAAAHADRRIVAHIHGGDRAPGQIDDSLRHAITKLSHIHFPATVNSAARLVKLGEDRRRIHRVGSPGIDGIVAAASSWTQLRAQFPRLARNRYGLVVLHPIESNGEYGRAQMLIDALHGFQSVVIYPNNDPGASEIIRCWNRNRRSMTYLLKDTARADFLGLMRNAAFMLGNSSSGIIEAASFGTPVVNIGPRQLGRDRSGNVIDVSYNRSQIATAIRSIWNNGRPRRWRGRNAYDGRSTGRRIASILAEIPLGGHILRKLIAY